MARPVGKAARNEQRTAFATTLNAVSVAFVVSAFLQPALTGHLRLTAIGLAGTAFVVLQLGCSTFFGASRTEAWIH